MSIIKRQTILGTIYSYIGVVVGTLTMALIVPNFFSVEEYGLINILSRYMMVLVVAASLGYNNAGTRFFKYFRDPARNHKGYLFNGLCVLGVGLLLTALFLFFFKDRIVKTNSGDNRLFVNYYYLLLPLIISTGVFNLFDNYAKGLYDTVMGTFLSQLLQRALVLVSVIMHIAGLIDFRTFMYWWVAAMSAPMLFMILHSMRLGNFSLRPDGFLWNSPIKEEFFRFAGFSVLTGVSSMVITALDTMMVYRILGLGMSGVYNFCLLFGSVMTMSYNANVKASTPIVMDAIQKKENWRIEGIFKKSGTTQLMFGTVLLVLVWVSVDGLFSLVKPEYLLGKTALIIIGISKLYDLSCGVNSLILAYSRYYKYDSFLVLSFIGILYVLNHYLIPPYGLEGAAYATLIATIYYNTARNILIWKFFRIHPYSWGQVKIVGIGAALLVLGMLLPELKGSVLLSLLSISYRSVILILCFAGLFYVTNISQEVNEVMEKAVKMGRAFLRL